MRLKLHILVALITLSSVLGAYCAPPPDADDDHFFRVKPAAGTADPTKKPATVNPKKSPLPIGMYIRRVQPLTQGSWINSFVFRL